MTYTYRGSTKLDDSSPEVCWGARGTVAGYQRHLRRGERPCERCREAYNAYHRALRSKDPKHKARTKRYLLAKSRAWRELARRHPVEFSAIFQRELDRVPESQVTS